MDKGKLLMFMVRSSGEGRKAENQMIGLIYTLKKLLRVLPSVEEKGNGNQNKMKLLRGAVFFLLWTGKLRWQANGASEFGRPEDSPLRRTSVLW